MIDAGQFAKPIIATVDGHFKFRFGIADSGEIAATLRAMADAVEAHQILIQRVQTGQIAHKDDYYVQAILIEFVEEEKTK